MNSQKTKPKAIKPFPTNSKNLQPEWGPDSYEQRPNAKATQNILQ